MQGAHRDFSLGTTCRLKSYLLVAAFFLLISFPGRTFQINYQNLIHFRRIQFPIIIHINLTSNHNRTNLLSNHPIRSEKVIIRNLSDSLPVPRSVNYAVVVCFLVVLNQDCYLAFSASKVKYMVSPSTVRLDCSSLKYPKPISLESFIRLPRANSLVP